MTSETVRRQCKFTPMVSRITAFEHEPPQTSATRNIMNPNDDPVDNSRESDAIKHVRTAFATLKAIRQAVDESASTASATSAPQFNFQKVLERAREHEEELVDAIIDVLVDLSWEVAHLPASSVELLEIRARLLEHWLPSHVEEDVTDALCRSISKDVLGEALADDRSRIRFKRAK